MRTRSQPVCSFLSCLCWATATSSLPRAVPRERIVGRPRGGRSAAGYPKERGSGWGGRAIGVRFRGSVRRHCRSTKPATAVQLLYQN